MSIDSVPPITPPQHSPEQVIPGECGPKDESCVKSGEQNKNKGVAGSNGVTVRRFYRIKFNTIIANFAN